ncbi:scoloptoxin SSD14 [Rhipicephalus microplus]|uniref:scoloptoxin SSD14 n=1 Tax=Rhipicephalus microplus TaxID=6941 RepID=UPI003F6CA95A
MVLDEGVPDYQLRQSARTEQRSASGRTAVDVAAGGDSLQRSVSPRRGSQWSLLCSLVVAGVVELSLILAVVYARRIVGGSGDSNVVFRLSGGDLRVTTPYTNHTTAADVPDLCGTIPRQVYSRGGTVADCAVAFALCMAVVAPHRVGLGGGFLATIYERKSKQVFVLDALPMAPRNLSEVDEDVNASVATSSSGGKVIATPGYLAGLEALHSRFGRLTWSSLFESAVSLAHFGFPVYPELAAVLARFQKTIARRHSLRHIFWNRQTGSVYRENETLLQPELALTLLRVAREGPKALSQGTLASQFVGDLEGLGSPVTQEDLVLYRPAWKAPVQSVSLAGARLHAPPPPGSGPLLAFMLATMDMFRSSRKDLLSDGPLTYHRFIEAMKFAHPFREDLGDDAVENVDDTVANLVSRGQALKTSGRISDTSTFSDVIFYVFDMQLVRDTIRGVAERESLEHYGDIPREPEHDASSGNRHGGVHYDRATRRPRSRSSKKSTATHFEVKHAAANAVFLAPNGDAIAFSGSLGTL